jgi:glycosyltransferase involved in cell wall biosynthesis
MSTVDVIVPCYRYGHYLRACVESVLTQEDVQLRVLIIDDESPDNTAEVGQQLANEDPRVTFRRHAVNQKHIATYNEGIEWVESKYFLLLSADDYLLPGALARAAALMDGDDGISFCYGDALELHDDGSFVQAITGLPAPATSSRVLSGAEFIEVCRSSGTTNTVPTPTAVVRTRLQKKLGGYRPELPHTGDLEIWLRLAAHGRVGLVASNQAVYRRHGNNMSLSYYADHRLADLRQRLAAVDWFCQSCKSVLEDAAATRRSLVRPLARDAIHGASGAFNDRKLDVVQRLSEFALEADAGVKWTLPWFVLACKRRLGHRVSNVLTPTMGALRRTAARMFT